MHHYEGGLSEDDLREMVLRLAHEVRNPLATIKAAVQLIQRLTQPGEDVARHCSSALAQVARIDLTVHGMQRFIKLGNARPERVEIDRLVRDVVGAHESEARNGHVSVSVLGGPVVTAFVDPEHLRMALDELLSNAVRFSPSETSVRVSWTSNDAFAVVHVDDEGPGIRPEHAARIMRPFFSTSTQGTGLGLNIAEKACRLAGGRLAWHNNPGRGCRFSLIVPEG